MKRPLAVLAGIAILCALSPLGAAPPKTDRHSHYTDAVYGFSLDTPRFPKAGPNDTVLSFMVRGKEEGGAASNFNVVIQPPMSRAQYREVSVKEFEQVGLKVNSERELKVSGRDAILWDFEGTQNNLYLHYLSLAVIDRERVIQVTCGASPEAFKDIEDEFRACIDSFKLE